MRRLIANAVLLITLGLFLAPAMIAAAPQPVPACCRRGGAHHCAMTAAMMQTDGTAIRCDNPCPMRQVPQLGNSIVALVMLRTVEIGLTSQSVIATAYRAPDFLHARLNHERGPPQTLFG